MEQVSQQPTLFSHIVVLSDPDLVGSGAYQVPLETVDLENGTEALYSLGQFYK
jgi:hypothetical protein